MKVNLTDIHYVKPGHGCHMKVNLTYIHVCEGHGCHMKVKWRISYRVVGKKIESPSYMSNSVYAQSQLSSM